MTTMITVNRPEVAALVEAATKKMNGGNKTEVVALAMRHELEQDARASPLFGGHKGSVRVATDVGLTAPSLDIAADAVTSREVAPGAKLFCLIPTAPRGSPAAITACAPRPAP